MNPLTTISSILISIPLFLFSIYTTARVQNRNVEPTGIWNCIDANGNKVPNCEIPMTTLSPTPTKIGADSGSINFNTIVRESGNGSVKEKKEYIITNATQAEYQSLWNSMYSGIENAPVIPEIDFTKEMVLVATLGQVNSGGYEVEITNIKEERNVIKVTVFETKPGEGCMATQALTSPFHFVKMPATTKKIEFVRAQQTRSC